MVRRERRQWVLIAGLLLATVASGVTVVTIGFNVADPRPQATRGDGTHVLIVSPAEEAVAVYADAKSAFSDATLITGRSVRPDGSASTVELRSLDPNSVAGPRIALLDGRYPTADNEVAGTARQVARLGIDIGGTITFLDQSLSLVGIVENPERLSEQFLLAMPGLTEGERAEILVTATDQAVSIFEAEHELVFLGDTRDGRTGTAVLIASLVAAVLAEVALLAVAALTVVAQRRIRQLGILAALGANRRQLRAAVIAGAVVVGSLSSIVGVTLGVLTSWAIVPQLETLADRRINNVEYPWAVIAAVAVAATAATIIAAWWPARRTAAIGVAGALRSQRPATRPVLKMSIVGITLVAAGTGIVLANATDGLTNSTVPIVVYLFGVVAIPIGAVLLAPASVRLWGWLAPRLGLVGKVAARDIGRYQTRSAATVAALIVVFTVPVFVAAGSRILERSDANVPTMATNQVIVALDQCRHDVAACIDALPELERAAANLGAAIGAQVIPLEQPVSTFEAMDGFNNDQVFIETVDAGILTQEGEQGTGISVVPSYVATPDLLNALGLAQGVFDGVDVVTNRRGEFVYFSIETADAVRPDTELVDFPRYELTPGALFSPSFVGASGWQSVTTSWLLQAEDAISDADIALLIRTAEPQGLTIATAEPAFKGTNTRTWALLAAGLVALGIIAIIGALHRTETGPANATYEAIGARTSFRRTVHALTMTMLVVIALGLAVPAGLLLQLGFAKDILGTARIWESIPTGFVAALVTVVPLATLGLGLATAAPNHRPGHILRPFS